MKKKQNGYGLLLFYKNLNAILLKSKTSYVDTNKWVEYIQIPRGHIEHHENSLETAIREFIEETNIYPSGQFFISQDTLTLKWIDNNKQWEYKIYIAFCDNLKVGKNNVVNVKIKHNYIYLEFLPKKLKDENYEVTFLSLSQYTQIILQKQIHSYMESNYKEFLHKLKEKKLLKKNFKCKRIIILK